MSPPQPTSLAADPAAMSYSDPTVAPGSSPLVVEPSAVDAAARALATKKLLALLSLYFIWGSTYLAIAVAVETMPPFLMAAARHLVAGVLLFAWARRQSSEPIRREHWKSAAVVGVALLAVGNGLVVWAETRVASGLAALLVATVPLWMVTLEAVRRDGNKPTAPELLGVLVGFAGLVLLVGPGALSGSGSVDLLGALALVVASLSWSAGSLYARGASLPKAPLLATSMEMLAGGAALVLVGLLAGESGRLDLSTVSLGSWLALAYLVVFGSLIGFTAYVWLLGVAKPAQVATYAYVNPVVAVLLGWLFLAEPIGPRTVLAAAVIIAGVAVITWGKTRRR
jgi:drug/metabolite transporter (DMT)-like permease